METATQLLHRLTSYEPGREWDDVISDPRLVLGYDRRSRPGAGGPAPHDGDAAIVVTGVPWRTGWRYRERGYRHLY